MAKLSNPVAFNRVPVSILSTLIYIAIVVVLITVQTTVPSAPTSATPVKGINLTEAWHDLQILTEFYHPYNSHSNDYVHDWLLSRILVDNKPLPSIVVFDDTLSNLTFSSPGVLASSAGTSVYFEGTNIIVYIRGSDDDESPWWEDFSDGMPKSKNGVLVNAHYDSVSTGFGATDDGMGVITVLQLLKYYTTDGNQPKNGLVLLLNNGEEDFLNGARVFSQHPMSRMVSTFLNLEGAGAGGRATLFRSTDEEVTKAYARSEHPFGTVLSGDGFQRGFIRSQTDYVVFNGIMELRGLDVAFMEPRARYHTNEDDTRHSSRDSLWHMLSAALATTKELTSKDFSQTSSSDAVWFDLFGSTFAIFRLHTLFALSVTLLVVSPLVLVLTMVFLHRADKLYLFSNSTSFHRPDGDEKLPLYGWRGVFRYPVILTPACAAPIALAYLMVKENAFIAHSSEWAVWSMMISSFLCVAWFLCRAAEYVRPSALTRAYSFTWMFMAWWVALVVDTTFETQLKVAGGYFIVLYFATVFLTTWISYLELFSLPGKSKYCLAKLGYDSEGASRNNSQTRGGTSARSEDNYLPQTYETEEEEASERSRLLPSRVGRSAYKNRGSDTDNSAEPLSKEENLSQPEEQPWSKSLASYLWLLQFLIIIPINLIIVGQIALLIVSALHQTGADGSSMFLVYVLMAVFTILMFSIVVPFLHRFTWHVPAFLFLVLIGTLIYNLLAFPFSPNNRLKLFFEQTLDLDTNISTTSLVGISPFVQDAINALPSAAGQQIDCVFAGIGGTDRRRCSWNGPSPNVVDNHSKLPAKSRWGTWMNYNVSKTPAGGAHFMVYGRNTRACKLVFDDPIEKFHVQGQGPTDKRFASVPDGGSLEIRLWSRTWERVWSVDVDWDGQGKKKNQTRTGKVMCMWSDANHEGLIPAFDEVKHFAPEWVAVTKLGDGLVVASRGFSV